MSARRHEKFTGARWPPAAARASGQGVRTVLVSRRHIRLLVVLAAEEYVSPEVLAARLGMPLARVEQLLDDLQEAGLVASATLH